MPAIDPTTRPNAQKRLALVADEHPGSPCIFFRTRIPADAGGPSVKERNSRAAIRIQLKRKCFI